ncbi:DNA-binding response regulator [Streptomyces tateyamensis]|uniref:DNA-binding response regulator n=1 Tax=Streptomyces tateyamensis TaxID=565073 RepID=A0A2V4NHL8_9ACTN|nr:response regulator transcription factor [Streptomyces tateyamensis]PYC64743.1 DNA-binding response regulator [Streptomyces tateyamensis]
MTAPAAERVRILVADDHTLLREALCELLGTEPGFEVVGQAGNGAEAVRLAARHRPDVVLLDVQMPQNDPPVTVQRILSGDPRTRIIVLTMDDSPQLVAQLRAAGVQGYLHKSVSRDRLVAAVRQRTAAEDDGLPPAPQREPAAGGLSARELEVLHWAARALSNRQIGSRLGITEGTVKRHLRNIFGKLDAVSRIDAVNIAIDRGLIHR